MEELIKQGYISKTKHPDFDLYIYNYTPKTQFERMWNEHTLKCRGLILDGEGKVVAQPFEKFFNYGEVDWINEDYTVTEKLDGSLGILYYADGYKIATRGSFTSDQAVFATKLLNYKYKGNHHLIDPHYTYLFEIIYPENRIVVDYGKEEKLVLLTAIHNETREEIRPEIGFELAPSFPSLSPEELKSLNIRNKEGFVLRFTSGKRLKVKFQDYIDLHRIISNLTPKVVWENLIAGTMENLYNVPDEFYKMVKEIEEKFNTSYEEIEKECNKVFKRFPTRKEAAQYYLTQKYPSILFKMLDNKDYKEEIWKILKP